MNAMSLAWKNIKFRPLKSWFSVLLVALSVGLLLIVQSINSQLDDHFSKNLNKTDLILSAKGSPLQSVLCNLYHADVPTGNIEVTKAKAFLKSSHPLIEHCLPISLGDQFLSYRIVGTTDQYLDWYKLKLQQGLNFTTNHHAVLGHRAAQESKLHLGSHFQGGHGLIEDSTETHGHSFEVVGILEPTGSVVDQLIFVPISAYWELHSHHGNDDEHHHEHEEDLVITNNDSLAAQSEKEITALLLKFKGTNIASLNFGRNVNENTELMASAPAIEMNRLYELTGSAGELLSWIALLIGFTAFIAIFIHLWHALYERRQETSLLRLSGAGKLYIGGSYILEATILVGIGLGIAIIGSQLFLQYFCSEYGLSKRFSVFAWRYNVDMIWTIFIALLCGIFAGVVPAFLAGRRDIAADIYGN
ncbi:MAG TPA: ABC transporter permease [Saprospiraceae bacterium]|nr:ABC transporter permease [Saprospiraceae bacterium]